MGSFCKNGCGLSALLLDMSRSRRASADRQPLLAELPGALMAHPTSMSRAQRTQLLEKMNSGICAPASFSSRRYSPQVLAQAQQSLDLFTA